MTPEILKAEYDRLGYDAGYSFGMTSTANLKTAEVVLVGLNPGGDWGEQHWDYPQGNAYLDERWGPQKTLSPIQIEVRELMELLSVEGPQLFAGQLIPFRSPRFGELARQEEALAFARRLWTWALAEASARLFVCMGQDAAWQIADLLRARPDGEHPTGWGTTVVCRYVSADGRVVVSLPHPSWYKLLGPGRDPAERRAAKLAILQAARPA